MFEELDPYETERVTEIFSLHPPEKLLFFKCQETGTVQKTLPFPEEWKCGNAALHRRYRIKRHTLLSKPTQTQEVKRDLLIIPLPPKNVGGSLKIKSGHFPPCQPGKYAGRGLAAFAKAGVKQALRGEGQPAEFGIVGLPWVLGICAG